MPVHGRPLLDYWLSALSTAGVSETSVNLHHFQDQVLQFLNRAPFADRVSLFFEEALLGTAGSVRAMTQNRASSLRNSAEFSASEVVPSELRC